MDTVYSLTLLIALIAASVSAVGGLTLRLRRPLPAVGALGRVLRASGPVAVVFGVLSLAVHLAFGHRPGTAEALGPIAFFDVHPSFLAVFALAALGLVVRRRA
ncbi:MAG: hypothetical protein AAF657_01750 [Acidobacteriota bacterium]